MDQVLLDSFQENLALIHPDGKIYATNLAWKKFALENGADPSYSDIDRNYIELLSAVQTKEIVPYFQPEIDTVINKVVFLGTCPTNYSDIHDYSLSMHCEPAFLR
ncbi:hypothetical protein ACF3OH_13225 [Chryseomicrobium aureum]|uniref:hypothetical protein n=1 Tax=Chryseomicrobium aureum TaxID=1441723 RepID=UPI0035962751